MNDQKIKIIRCAVGSMPAWGLITELKKANFDVIGVDSNPLSFGLYLLDNNYVIPPGGDSDYIKEMLKIIDKEKPSAILSGPEEETITLSKNKDLIEGRGVLVLCPDYDSVEICMNKIKTYNFFKNNNIPTPKCFDDINSIEYPCLIKPQVGRGSVDVYIIKNEEELLFYLKKVKKPIIQEFIDGEEYTIDILADKDGNTLSVIPRLRLDIESGISVKGKTVYDKKIIDYCKKIVKKLKLFGPSCIQCIKNKDEIKFIEINIRFGGGSILSIKADSTIIPNLIKLINGEKTVPSESFKEGLIMLRYHSEVFISDEEIKKEC